MYIKKSILKNIIIFSLAQYLERKEGAEQNLKRIIMFKKNDAPCFCIIVLSFNIKIYSLSFSCMIFKFCKVFTFFSY